MPHNDAKHRAKRWNERVKLVATLFNSVAIVTVAAVLINPLASKRYDPLADGGWLLLFGAVLSHILAQSALSFTEAEDRDHDLRLRFASARHHCRVRCRRDRFSQDRLRSPALMH